MTVKICQNGKIREVETGELDLDIQETPQPEPTSEERLDELETTTEDMILLMADLIGGN